VLLVGDTDVIGEATLRGLHRVKKGRPRYPQAEALVEATAAALEADEIPIPTRSARSTCANRTCRSTGRRSSPIRGGSDDDRTSGGLRSMRSRTSKRRTRSNSGSIRRRGHGRSSSTNWQQASRRYVVAEVDARSPGTAA
jgi:hypothetical protein